MNVAYLDPPYSRYFHELAARLVRRSGGRSTALLSSPAYRLYCGDDRSIVWAMSEVSTDYGLPQEFAAAGWAQHDAPCFRKAFSSAVEWFRECFQRERTDLCLVFSDARPFSVAARLAAHELGVVCLYFERGAFRFSTASLSTLGLNARFSLKQAGILSGISGVSTAEPLRRRPTEPWLRARFARFIVHNALACLVSPDRGRLQHKRYAIGPYVRLALAQWWNAHHQRRLDDVVPMNRRGIPVIVVPLQLESDSQLVLHSPFSGNQAFLDFVVAEAHRALPGSIVLVKRHPMDSQRYCLPSGARWVGGNLGRFFDADSVVVCINSTVGFEAAVHGVRVICFSPSFYTEAELVHRAGTADFGRCLAHVARTRPRPEAGEALRNAVLRWYQAPGDVWAFTSEDIEQTANIVRQHYSMENSMRDDSVTALSNLPLC